MITTPRHQVDVIVTEYGAAELQGKTVHQRGEALAAIAHPDFRDELLEAAERALGRPGAVRYLGRARRSNRPPAPPRPPPPGHRRVTRAAAAPTRPCQPGFAATSCRSRIRASWKPASESASQSVHRRRKRSS